MRDIPAFVAEKNKLWGKAFVLLFELDYTGEGDYIRWARIEKGTITFQGATFAAAGFSDPARSQNSRGEIPTFDIAFANPQRTLQSVLHAHILEGRSGRLITVHRDLLDDPTAADEEGFTIVTASVNEQIATLTCAGVRFNALRAKVPRRVITRDRYPGVLGNTRGRYV